MRRRKRESGKLRLLDRVQEGRGRERGGERERGRERKKERERKAQEVGRVGGMGKKEVREPPTAETSRK